MIETTLTLSGHLHARLHDHLFPGDGLEAAAILLCAKTPGPRLRLLAKELILVPHAACKTRERDQLFWPGEYLEQAIDKGESDRLALILVHSHPGGTLAYSEPDDESDRDTVPCLHHAYRAHHGTAIMISDGGMIARLTDVDGTQRPVDLVSVIGDDIRLFWHEFAGLKAAATSPMAFTQKMRDQIGRLRCVVIGVSGIGSIVVEQVARLGFGEVILIDFDMIEKKNLNRILNSTIKDAELGRLKVHVMSDAIASYRGAGVANPLATSISTREAVLLLSQADVIFACMDTFDGRQIADLAASTFLIPLIDGGVAIPTRTKPDGELAIAEVTGRVDYIQPGGSTLSDRGVYTDELLRNEHLARTSPADYQHLVDIGYIKGMIEAEPSVITLNMRAAAAMVGEFIARAFPFRLDGNRPYARTKFHLAACEEDYSAEDEFVARPNHVLARGDAEPLLGIHSLGCAP